MLGYPPFAAMAEIALWGRDAPALERKARELAAQIRRMGIGEVLGPAEIRAAGDRGMQLVAKAAEASALDAVLAAALPPVKGRKTVARYD
jgi:primosomal protein N'